MPTLACAVVANAECPCARTLRIRAPTPDFVQLRVSATDEELATARSLLAAKEHELAQVSAPSRARLPAKAYAGRLHRPLRAPVQQPA